MPEVRLPESPFDVLLGTEYLSDDPDCARARIRMRDNHRQPMAIMHGGVMASLVESLCSMATAKSVVPENRIAMGQNVSLNLLRPVSSGGIEVEAVAVHRGRMTWVWRAEVKDFEGRICAIAQLTMAIRDAPDGLDLSFLVTNEEDSTA
jgi:uncharacterized protein (TIGR00369 family)